MVEEHQLLTHKQQALAEGVSDDSPNGYRMFASTSERRSLWDYMCCMMTWLDFYESCAQIFWPEGIDWEPWRPYRSPQLVTAHEVPELVKMAYTKIFNSGLPNRTKANFQDRVREFEQQIGSLLAQKGGLPGSEGYAVLNKDIPLAVRA
eukprot:Cvel_20073.t2-p1 / transcript=Cvel_20073.t2 / gene=Cvel_20073 / organism=Chromera_velia_CCMP2878 / gene_product=hypothetical protein / transcript_product=hypothetical protein / location=Cvel_scaffold1776:5643-6086(-) / protein_length=148 / sequence_SO=supercontig / SO=protein_coding / is_pseudo=false